MYLCKSFYCQVILALNPGPMMGNATENISFVNPDFILHYRMLRYGLRPLDVGGGGDCLFKSISHQLYGDSSHHIEIRALGVVKIKSQSQILSSQNFREITLIEPAQFIRKQETYTYRSHT